MEKANFCSQEWKEPRQHGVRTYQGQKYETLKTDSIITLTKNDTFTTLPHFEKSEKLKVKTFTLDKVNGIESLQGYAGCKNGRQKMKSNKT